MKGYSAISKIILSQDSDAIIYLSQKDKHLAKVISMVGDITYETYNDYYAFLIHEIIEQMLSIKASAKIYSRFVVLCNGDITPEQINQLTDSEIKSIETANSKVKSIRELTNAILQSKINFDEYKYMSDNDFITSLTSIYGIGTCTTKMFFIFSLNRSNVLPYEDVAFLQGYKWVYSINETDYSSVHKKCRKWSPYASIATRYMYKAVDLELTKNKFHLFK